MFGLDTILSIGSNLLGGALDRENQEDVNNANARLQREFAMNGIRWKVEDAKAAGIHPLYALGAQTMPAAPSYVGDNFGKSIADAGQDISRAIDSTRTGAERTASRVQALTIERGELENELIRTQIRRLNQQSGPPGPGGEYNLDGQTGSGVKLVPREVTMGKDSYEAGAAPANTRYTFNGDDSIRAGSNDFMQSIEDTPAHWYYTSTRTLPDMAWSDLKYVARPIWKWAGRKARSAGRFIGPENAWW